MRRKSDAGRGILAQAARFTLFSLSAGAVQAATFALLHELTQIDSTLGYSFGPSYFFSLLFSVIWNFTFNRAFAFKDVDDVPAAMGKVLVFYLFFAPLSVWLGEEFSRKGLNVYYVLLGIMLVNLVSEYWYCRLVIFRRKVSDEN